MTVVDSKYLVLAKMGKINIMERLYFVAKFTGPVSW